MMYLQDAWVNWFEGEENGYNVCYFHEWRKEDKIELLDQVPLLYITESLFRYIENDMHELPKGLLDTIFKKGFKRKGNEKQVLEYVCVITDGIDILAFDTAGYSIPVCKSRLIPRQEQIVYDMIKNAKPYSFQFDEGNYQKEYHILSMSPDLIFGLTRRERQLKQLLMIGLDQLRTSNNLDELRYWLTEWNPKKYTYIRSMDEKQVWQALYQGVKQGWSSAHEEFCRKLIQGQPFLENMWEIENGEKQNTSNYSR